MLDPRSNHGPEHSIAQDAVALARRIWAAAGWLFWPILILVGAFYFFVVAVPHRINYGAALLDAAVACVLSLGSAFYCFDKVRKDRTTAKTWAIFITVMAALAAGLVGTQHECVSGVGGSEPECFEYAPLPSAEQGTNLAHATEALVLIGVSGLIGVALGLDRPR